MQWSTTFTTKPKVYLLTPIQSNIKLERSKCKLIGKRQTHLRMLQHVVEAEVLDLVLGRVDLLVAVLELGFDDKGRWVAEAAGRGVVGTGVATLCFDVGNVTVLREVSRGFGLR